MSSAQESRHFRVEQSNSLRLTWLVYASIVVLLVLDWITPFSLVIASLLCVPVLATSALNRLRHVFAPTVLATVGSALDIFLSTQDPQSTMVLFSGRALLLLMLPTMGFLARQLQKRRVLAELSRDAALQAGQLNRLLVALVAHDLRAPLILAGDGFDYVERSVARNNTPDLSLINDVRARLRRSLRTIEGILAVARSDVAHETESSPFIRLGCSRASLHDVLNTEIESFREQAVERGKEIRADLSSLPERSYPTSSLMLGHALGVVLDNSIRHASVGIIHVSCAVQNDSLRVSVMDPGPSERDTPVDQALIPRGKGAGLGLELVRSLMGHAGGALEVQLMESGPSTFTLRLPLNSDPGPMAPGASGSQRAITPRMTALTVSEAGG